ncbi:1448_t:CDS:2, partial [Dentiscutata heterogama]
VGDNNPFVVLKTTDEINLNNLIVSDKRNQEEENMGPGIIKFTLSANTKKWVISTLDISSIILEYCDMSVQQLSENKVEDAAKIL